MKISKFLSEDLADYASYSTLRMIASCIDGQKNSGRKVLFTIFDKNIKKDKESRVSQLAAKVSEHAEYLHGEVSLQGVISNMAADYTGSNNVNLLEPKGNFGTRFTPEPSAPRYIYTFGNESAWNFFNQDDNAILLHQNFEGHNIEPRFYLPILPILVVNGAEGMATGFAQKILPRDPKKVRKYIEDSLKGTLRANKHNSLHPHYEGFKGTIIEGESSNQFEICGVIERLTKTKIKITEIPIGYSLKGYIKYLDKLEDEGFIQDYQDLSEDDNFEFILTFKKDILEKYDDDKLLDKLKLIKRISENYTAIDEENKVRTFSGVKEIIDYYIDIKKEYLGLRKSHLIRKLSRDIRVLVSKYLFIKAVVEDELKINKRKKKDIEKDLERFDKIVKVEDKYDYLLNMNIMSLTEERMQKLLNDIKEMKKELDRIKEISIENMWLEDLKGI